MRKLFPIRYDNVMKHFDPQYKDTVYYLCPRYGQPMTEENVPENRKCPNTQKRYGAGACKEGCYYVPYDEKYEPPAHRAKKKSKSLKRKIKGCGCK